MSETYTLDINENTNKENTDVVDDEGTVVVVEMDTVDLGDFSMEDDTPKAPKKVSKSKVSADSNKNPSEVKALNDAPTGDIEMEGSDDDVLTSSEKLRVYSDQIISAMVGKKSINTYALGKLLSITNPRLFRDENYIIFQVLYNYRDKVRRINIDDEFLQLYLYRNRNILEKAKSYIDIHAYGEVDGQEDLGYISGVVKHFNRLCGMDDMTQEEFDLCFEKYLIEFKAVEAAKVYAQSAMILGDGLNVGRKKLIGFEDSYNFVRKRLAEIEGLVNMNAGAGFVTMKEVLMDEKEDGKKSYKISDYGNLEALNKVYGGIYTGTFIQVLAPPKAGKTKMCARICHTTAVKYGNNVTVWAQEGGKEAWTAQMRAIHFDYTYNQDADARYRKYGVSQDVILRDNFSSNELRELEMSSKLDLASNPEYGNIDYVDRPFEVETFIEDIDTSVKSNNSKLVIIDYLQLIGSATGKNERERVAEAYQRLLTYCKANNVAVLTPGQYKQETFNMLVNKGSTEDMDMRTSGGGSSEVLRTPDIIFALWATTQDLMNNRMKILSMPCRFNKAFPEIPVYADLEVCDFISLDE